MSLLIRSDEVSTSRDEVSEGMLISLLTCLVERSIVPSVIHQSMINEKNLLKESVKRFLDV